MFPTTRLRRLRYNPAVRQLARHTRLSAANLVMPLFVRPGSGVRQEIASMPGNFQFSPELLVEEILALRDLGLGGVILFGIPAAKDALGSDSTSPEGIIAQAVRLAKRAAPEMLVMTDVCLCEYTDHGHCGPLKELAGRMEVDNDATLELLARQAVVHAQAGADLVAPSGMMDGMVGAIRRGLDGAGFTHIPIMSYAAKYASAFTGRSATRPKTPPRRATAAATRWTPPPRRTGPAGDRVGPGRRRRHDHGQAGPGLSRHHPPGR